MTKVKKARKKALEVEYIQFTGNNKKEIYDWSHGVCHNCMHRDKLKFSFVVDTLEGTMLINKNDYVVKGVNGEYYPVKPDIFYKTYEIMEDTNND